jgi:hypothetical protein
MNNNISEEESQLNNTNDTIPTLIKSIKLLIKVFGIRVIITLFGLFKSRRFNYKDILSHVFSMTNIKTCLSVSLLPLLYNTFLKIISLFTKHNIKHFLSAFLSALISISIEDKTSLTNYIILAIMVRSFHSLFSSISKKYNLFQQPTRLFDFSLFLITCLSVVTVSHLNPTYEPLKKLYDTYNKYIDDKEESEYILMRNLTRLV